MKKIIIGICILSCCASVHAQGLKNWAKKQDEAKKENPQPAAAQGRIFPHSIADNKVVFTGFESFEGLPDETVFVNALLWTANHGSKLKDDFGQIDYQGMRFTCKKTSASALPQQYPVCYHCDVSMQVSSDMLSFLVSGIVCESGGVLNTVKKIPFENLDPEKKTKHADYLKEFTETNSAELNALFEFIRSNKLPTITHWDEITQGKVAKGMNEVECTLAYGKPLDVKLSGDKAQWMYSSSTYLFFEKGVLTSHLR